jgi:hypothetical protein
MAQPYIVFDCLWKLGMNELDREAFFEVADDTALHATERDCCFDSRPEFGGNRCAGQRKVDDAAGDLAAFVVEHTDDPTVQISDYGNGWWIGGFPHELAPPVPEYGVFFSGDDQTALDAYAADGAVDPSGSLNVVSDWSWYGTDAVLTCDENTEFGDDGASAWDDSGVLYRGDISMLPFCSDWTCTLLPSASARGADVSESFVAYAAAADAERAKLVAVSPRSAAFADMGTMAAAATAMQASSADATPVGRQRRR